MGSANELFSTKIIVEDKDTSGQIKHFWHFESLGTKYETLATSNVYEEVIFDFESSIVFKDNRYKVQLSSKANLKKILNNNH